MSTASISPLSTRSSMVSPPLAEQYRPKTLEEVVGQNHILGIDAPLGRMLGSKHINSFLLWGPPGCGKTTIARLVAKKAGLYEVTLSAVTASVADLRKVFKLAETQPTLLFIDEIHRFNKAQQDSLLAPVEQGLITLVGATTENPSFEVNPALMSRLSVFTLKRLDESAMEALLQKISTNHPLPLNPDARNALIAMADGDGRSLFNMVEQILSANLDNPLDPESLQKLVSRRAAVYDKSEGHYNLISALHKSLRGSDAQAALYWLARMIEGGEDPHYIARRLLRFAFEDIGLADPDALTHALHAWETYHRLGSPEGELALAQCTLYLATAPKSNRHYVAWKEALRTARKSGSHMPPKHILNAPTNFMKQEGYSKGYVYDHDTEHGFSGQNYFPDELPRQNFYNPKAIGFEREIAKRLEYWEGLRKSCK